MNIRKGFYHIFWAKLTHGIIDFTIVDNLIEETLSFLIEKWVQIVIDTYINPRYRVKTGITQGLPVSPIFFLIYINRIVLEKERQLPLITCSSLIDNQRFRWSKIFYTWHLYAKIEK